MVGELLVIPENPALQELRTHYPATRIHGSRFTTETVWRSITAEVRRDLALRYYFPVMQNTLMLSQYSEMAVIVCVNPEDIGVLTRHLHTPISKHLRDLLKKPVDCVYLSLADIGK